MNNLIDVWIEKCLKYAICLKFSFHRNIIIVQLRCTWDKSYAGQRVKLRYGNRLYCPFIIKKNVLSPVYTINNFFKCGNCKGKKRDSCISKFFWSTREVQGSTSEIQEYGSLAFSPLWFNQKPFGIWTSFVCIL